MVVFIFEVVFNLRLSSIYRSSLVFRWSGLFLRLSLFSFLIFRYNVDCLDAKISFKEEEVEKEEEEEEEEKDEDTGNGYSFRVPEVQLELPVRPHRRSRPSTLYGVPVRY